jgi:hypothetical protein
MPERFLRAEGSNREKAVARCAAGLPAMRWAALTSHRVDDQMAQDAGVAARAQRRFGNFAPRFAEFEVFISADSGAAAPKVPDHQAVLSALLPQEDARRYATLAHFSLDCGAECRGSCLSGHSLYIEKLGGINMKAMLESGSQVCATCCAQRCSIALEWFCCCFPLQELQWTTFSITTSSSPVSVLL